MRIEKLGFRMPRQISRLPSVLPAGSLARCAAARLRTSSVRAPRHRGVEAARGVPLPLFAPAVQPAGLCPALPAASCQLPAARRAAARARVARAPAARAPPPPPPGCAAAARAPHAAALTLLSLTRTLLRTAGAAHAHPPRAATPPPGARPGTMAAMAPPPTAKVQRIMTQPIVRSVSRCFGGEHTRALLPAAALAQRTCRLRRAGVAGAAAPPHVPLHALTQRLPLCAHLPLRHFSLIHARAHRTSSFASCKASSGYRSGSMRTPTRASRGASSCVPHRTELNAARMRE
jgi:hypothetical protein